MNTITRTIAAAALALGLAACGGDTPAAEPAPEPAAEEALTEDRPTVLTDADNADIFRALVTAPGADELSDSDIVELAEAMCRTASVVDTRADFAMILLEVADDIGFTHEQVGEIAGIALAGWCPDEADRLGIGNS